MPLYYLSLIEGRTKKNWCLELSSCQNIYLYQYPLDFPETFLNYQGNFEFKIKFILLQYFGKISVDKYFSTQ